MDKFKQFHPLDWKEREHYRPVAILNTKYRDISESLGLFFFEAQDDLGYYKAACLEDMQGKRFILRNNEHNADKETEIWTVAENVDVESLVHHIIDVLGIDKNKIKWTTDTKHQWEGLPKHE